MTGAPQKKIFFIFFAAAAACTAPQPPPGSAGPVEAVHDFADAVHKGDTATAWSLLSSRTQAQADKLAAAARAGTDGGPDSGRQMLFQGAVPGGAVEPRLASQSGDSAEVRTGEDGGMSQTWHVVREAGRWRIDLDLGH